VLHKGSQYSHLGAFGIEYECNPSSSANALASSADCLNSLI